MFETINPARERKYTTPSVTGAWTGLNPTHFLGHGLVIEKTPGNYSKPRIAKAIAQI